MAKQEKEKCSKCGSDDFAMATTADGKTVIATGKRYCKKCQHVWVPGLEGMKREDVVLHHAQKENRELKEALDVERKAHAKTKKELAALKGEVKPSSDEEEIFS